MKPVSVELNLDYHGRLVMTVGDKIKDTIKRLHAAELLLNLEPGRSKGIEERQEWKHKMDDLMKREDMAFPALSEVRKEYLTKEELS